MTRNSHGVEFRDTSENFADWEWGDCHSEDLINAIRTEAAKTVLHVIAQRTLLGIYSGKKGCGIRVWLGDDMGELSIPFSTLIDQWIDLYGIGPFESPELIAALEDALAKIKAASELDGED